MNRFRPCLLIHHRHLHQLQNAAPLCSHLKSRSVIRFSGPDTIKFLQGLLSNDVRRFGESPHEDNSPVVPPMYAALLTPQGRFSYDFFLYRQSRPEEKQDRNGSVEILADVDGSVLDELLAILKIYRLWSKVDIENVAEDFYCWQRYGREPVAPSVGWTGGDDRSGNSASHGNGVGWQWFKDPRLDCLGFRGIFPSGTTPPLVESDKETDEEKYLLWRLEKGVAEGSTEIPKAYIARTHHRGVIRKRLLPLKFLDNNGKEVERKVTAGSEVINTASGKKTGSVTTAFGFCGMGVLRLEEAFKGSDSLTILGQEDIKVEAIRAAWWPSEWFRDQQHTAVA
ncbi:hypothetical protein ES319_A03G019200v1 [Gossypium barbadense]|uniref:CAF17 C-terminal domain-containing protein n=1 Tax=Gossypium barbadense TaxID=3634 RepID=A0A5J5W9H1_GOSBA|nr:hypothetical protein ES319_A03G019200v1 [Gossypium barbadense]